jgi:hypothetical protein
MLKILLVALLYSITLLPALSQNVPVKKNLHAVRVQEKIHIDGILSETIWHSPGYTDITQQEPDQGEKPSQRSEVWVAYDDEAIYFAAKYYDNHPDSIMARLVRRDFIWGDPSDGCVLYLDPYHDHRNGYFFYVSAAGTLADGIIENDVKQPNDLTWDAVWEGIAQIDSEGYCVEMKIPYSQLRFKEGVSQVWGIDAERYISRRNETDMIAYTPRNESGFASRFPDLVGIEGITPPARLEVLPYITTKAEYIGHDTNDPFNHDHRYLPGAGVDIKAGIGRSLTLDGTINPDFGQVEVDPANVNLTDVEFLFDEKRPFFTEGVGIFRFGQGGTNTNVTFNWNDPNIFYTRRIGRTPQRFPDVPDGAYVDMPSTTRILGAGKISGQIGDDWKIGTLHALTKREWAETDSAGHRTQIEIEPLTYYGVFRAQRDFNAGAQGFGILSTYTRRIYNDNALKDFTNSDALIAASDGWVFLDDERTYVLSGWGAISRVGGSQQRMIALQRSSGHYFQRPDVDYIHVDSSATSMAGYAGRFTLNKNRGRWTFNTAVGFLSPKFELNDLGSEAYSDFVEWHFLTSYRWNTPTSYYQNAGVNAAVYADYDFGGNKTAEGYWGQGYITLPVIYYGGNVSFNYNPQSYNSRLTRGGPLTLNPVSRRAVFNLYTDNREWWVINLSGSARRGDALYSRNLTAYVELKTTTTLTLSVGPSFTRDINEAQYVGLQADPSAVETFGNSYLFAHLDRSTFAADIRADWIISPRLSVQVYIQPYITSGKYSAYKSLARPKTFEFEPVVTDRNDDFNYVSLRGNAVLRWEYLPGSVLFLVWTQNRAEIEPLGEFQFGNSMDRMFKANPDNILLLKVSYWFGV